MDAAKKAGLFTRFASPNLDGSAMTSATHSPPTALTPFLIRKQNKTVDLSSILKNATVIFVLMQSGVMSKGLSYGRFTTTMLE